MIRDSELQCQELVISILLKSQFTRLRAASAQMDEYVSVQPTIKLYNLSHNIIGTHLSKRIQKTLIGIPSSQQVLQSGWL